MKNYNTETQGFAAFVKKSIMLFVISTGFLSLSACNNKNENSNPVATNPYSYGTGVPASCAGCFTGAMGHIYRGTIEQNGVLADMTFWGDTTMANSGYNFSNNAYPPVTNYVGPFQVSGYIDFRIAQGVSSCSIPAGRYDLRTLSSGQWNMGTASGGQMVATMAGYTLNLTLNQFVVGARPVGTQDWISVPRPHTGKGYVYLIVQSVNNFPCNMTISLAAN